MTKVNKKVVGYLAILPLLVSVLLLVGCVSKDKFAHDPIKWSFVRGDGTWDSSSRKWTVSFSPGETKSITIRLYNSGSRTIKVFTVSTTATDLIQLSPQVRVPVVAGGSVDITFTATALDGASGKYTINYGYSFNEEQ